jgi:putative transport protein
LEQHLGAIVTEIHRGDVDMLPIGRTELQIGDRLQVVAGRENMSAVAKLLGNSLRQASHFDVFSLTIGLLLGLLLGMVPLATSDGVVLRLGFAGGPLVVSLILGMLGRTGPVVWTLPLGVNQTLRQFGLILFLAGVGSRSGDAFFRALGDGSGWAILAAGAVVTSVICLIALWIGYRILKLPMSALMGTIAGLTTQSAVLAYAQDQTKNDLPSIGFATVYPLSVLAKILVVQAVLVSVQK